MMGRMTRGINMMGRKTRSSTTRDINQVKEVKGKKMKESKQKEIR